MQWLRSGGVVSEYIFGKEFWQRGLLQLAEEYFCNLIGWEAERAKSHKRPMSMLSEEERATVRKLLMGKEILENGGADGKTKKCTRKATQGKLKVTNLEKWFTREQKRFSKESHAWHISQKERYNTVTAKECTDKEMQDDNKVHHHPHDNFLET